MAPNSLTEGLVHLGRVLGTTVRNSVQGYAMEMNHMDLQELGCLGRRREFGECHKVGLLGKMVNYG